MLEELLREKAAVLTRAGWAVEEVLEKMKRIEGEIEIKSSLMKSMDHETDRAVLSRRKKIFCEEINCKIDEYNTIREKAELQYYYLIVTREALGLRRHQMVQKIYHVPEKKKKIQAEF